ncbi:hypothetical protein E9840_01745 [Tissierella creatinini]|nr:hypothetical protein E9840_01745 [Tissierella creatinini]TJX66492.1 hypothetical protein E8P77_07540 [Soehngenia saccharolytica]
MIIKKYVCKRFAGIKDKDISFKDGLNVVLGANEAGKSTMVEGIHSVLFKSSRVGNRAKEDIGFKDKFMPVTSGDSIDGELILSHVDGEYTIRKQWGTEASSQLITPNSDIIKSEEAIRDRLKEVLLFGENTYSNIFFSKQSNLKEAIGDIIHNREITGEISSLLRKAIMELDGVSLDKLQKKIDDNLNDLYSHWDIEKNYPENNRGVNNPYKVGLGKILESFYRKESLRLEIDRANESEKNYNEICNTLKSAELRIAQLKEKKEGMERLENDVTQRLILEPQMIKLDSDMDTLKKVNTEWPKNEQRLEGIIQELKILSEDFEKLNYEKDKAKNLLEKTLLMNKLARANDLKGKLDLAQAEIGAIKDVTKDHIKDLEKNHSDMLKTEAMLNAGVIIGQFNYFNGNNKLIITKGFGQPLELEEGQVFRGDGYVKLESQGLFELEIKSGDMDFKELRSRFEEYRKNIERLLKDLEVEDIEEAKLNRERLEALKASVENLKNQLGDLLGESTLQDLEERIESLGDLGDIRETEVIEEEVNRLNKKHLELLSDKKLLESNIEKWTQMYGNLDGLFDKTINIKMEQKQVGEKLSKLNPLPDEYKSAEDFRNDLNSARVEYDSLQISLSDLKKLHFEAENNLPELSYEDLLEDFKAEESLFNKRLNEGKNLLKIKESFNNTKRHMDESSFTPVVKAFSKYLSLLTNGNFKESNIDNDFNLRLEKENKIIIPLNLLSSGTYDSVALALRLSILEYILGDNKGFLILDDCLVDLDSYRRETAARLIGEFASKHQVIFTTCSPDTAQLLGGNLIEI